MLLKQQNEIYANSDVLGNTVSLHVDRQEFYQNRYDFYIKINEKKFTVNKFSSKKDTEMFIDLLNGIIKTLPNKETNQ